MAKIIIETKESICNLEVTEEYANKIKYQIIMDEWKKRKKIKWC